YELNLWFDRLARELGCTRGSVVLYDLAMGDYAVKVGLKESNDQVGNRYQSGQGRTGWVISNARPLLIADGSKLRDLANRGTRLTDSPHQQCWDPKTERMSFLGVP